MMSSDQADARLAQWRAALRLQSSRRALDVLLAHVSGLSGYQLEPAQDSGLDELHYVQEPSGQHPFSLSVANGALFFDVRQAGIDQVAGGLPALEAGLGAVNEIGSGTWRVRLATPAQAEALCGLLFSTGPDRVLTVRHWWANLAHPGSPEIDDGYVWGRRKPANGKRSPSQQHLTRMVPGDIVFGYFDATVAAIGIVLERARGAPDPKLADGYGWLVPVRFVRINEPLRLKDYLSDIERHRPAKHSPLRAAGNARAAATSGAPFVAPLLELVEADAQLLRRLLRGQVEDLEQRLVVETDGRLAEQALEEQLWQRTDIGPCAKRDLSCARVGAGVFRMNVERIETACRVTGILDRRYLRTTHIKPWKNSDDREKVDGNNGLLLSPHMLHLFDRGHIAFGDDGTLLISRHLNPYVRKAWGLEHPAAARAFRPEQRVFLDFHRTHIFERVGGGRRAGEAA